MSIIDDVRIKQDLDKDGKYVCDLNHKEETKFDIHLRKAMLSNTPVTAIDLDTKFSLDSNGIRVPGTNCPIIPPTVYMNIALKWLQYSNKYSWGMKDLAIPKKDYISNLIDELQKLI